MKKLLIASFVSIALLSGCAVAPIDQPVKPSIIIQDHYVVSPIPAQDLVVPAQVPDIDLGTATQKTVSDWLAESEGRSLAMETQLKNIAQIQADQVAAALKLNVPLPASSTTGN